MNPFKKKSSKRWLLVVPLVVVPVAAGLGLLGYQFVKAINARNQTLPRRPAVAEEVRQAEVAAAFADKLPADDDADPETLAVRVFFRSLNDCRKKSNRSLLETHLDRERLYQETMRQVTVPLSPFEKSMYRSLLWSNEARYLVADDETLGWDRCEIYCIQFLADPNEAKVFARHWFDEESLENKYCWWLRRRNGKWQLYDYEDLHDRWRRSDSVALDIDLANQPGLLSASDTLEDIRKAFKDNDLDAVEKGLNDIRLYNLPARYEYIRWINTAYLRMRRFQYREALEAFAMAEKHHPNTPNIDYQRAIVHNLLGERDLAIHHGRKYLQYFGNDARMQYQIGVALVALNRREEAADAYRKGLEADAGYLNNLLELRHVLPAGKKAELADWFARLPAPQDQFESLAGDALGEQDLEGLDVLIGACQKIKKPPTALAYYQARCKVRKKEVREGVALFKQALKQEPELPKQQNYTYGFLWDMVAAGYITEGYEAVEDRSFAFRVLAGYLLDEFEDCDTYSTELLTLIQTHSQKQPKDLWVNYYTGLILKIEGDFDKAEKEFAAAVKAGDRELLDAVQHPRVHARYHAGKGLSAYEDFGGEVFTQLAWYYSFDKDDKGLAALVEAHRKNQGKATDLARWTHEVHWLRKEYEPAAKALVNRRLELLADTNHRWVVSDRLFRCYIRLRQFDQAAKEMDEKDKFRKPLQTAILHAAQGDLAATEQALEECIKNGHWSDSFYFDDDLGPLMRTEAFKKLREKYPEMKD